MLLTSDALCFPHPVFVPFHGDLVTPMGLEAIKLEFGLSELTDTQAAALGRLLPSLLCSEELAFQVFCHITLAMLAHACLAFLRKIAAGKKIRSANPNQARSAAGVAAPHHARTAPAAVASGLDASARPPTRPRLVDMAASSRARRSPLSLALANASP